jgi:hypothetical protein
MSGGVHVKAASDLVASDRRAGRTLAPLKLSAYLLALVALGAAWLNDRRTLEHEILSTRLNRAAERTAFSPLQEMAWPSPTAVPSVSSPVAAGSIASPLDPTLPTEIPAMQPNAAPPPSIEDQHAFLQTTFEQQRADMTWAREARSTLTADIERRLPKSSSIRTLECRTALCRAEIRHADEAGYRDLMSSQFSGEQSHWSGAFLLWRSGQGDNWDMTMFFAKPGAEMPSLQ